MFSLVLQHFSLERCSEHKLPSLDSVGGLTIGPQEYWAIIKRSMQYQEINVEYIPLISPQSVESEYPIHMKQRFRNKSVHYKFHILSAHIITEASSVSTINSSAFCQHFPKVCSMSHWYVCVSTHMSRQLRRQSFVKELNNVYCKRSPLDNFMRRIL